METNKRKSALKTAKKGEEVPDFELTGVDGKTYRLSDIKAKRSISNFGLHGVQLV